MNNNISLSEHEVDTVVSALLFSASVNVVANTDQSFQKELIDTAKRIKSLRPDLKLSNVQFIKEDNYEDEYSVEIYNNFKDNMDVTTFENV